MTATTTTGTINAGSVSKHTTDYNRYLENLGLVAISGFGIFGLGTVAISLCLIALEILQ